MEAKTSLVVVIPEYSRFVQVNNKNNSKRVVARFELESLNPHYDSKAANVEFKVGLQPEYNTSLTLLKLVGLPDQL